MHGEDYEDVYLSYLRAYTFMDVQKAGEVDQGFVRALRELCAASDVLFVNFGVHWNSPADVFERDLSKLLVHLRRCVEDQGVQKIVWREEFAQHFLGPGGHWKAWWSQNNPPSSDAAASKLKVFAEKVRGMDSQQFLGRFEAWDQEGSCSPMAYLNRTMERRWRRGALMRAAAKMGLSLRELRYDETDFDRRLAGANREFVFLPAFEVTEPLHFMHHKECCHYCSSPLLWEFLWEGLYRALAV